MNTTSRPRLLVRFLAIVLGGSILLFAVALLGGTRREGGGFPSWTDGVSMRDQWLACLGMSVIATSLLMLLLPLARRMLSRMAIYAFVGGVAAFFPLALRRGVPTLWSRADWSMFAAICFVALVVGSAVESSRSTVRRNSAA